MTDEANAPDAAPGEQTAAPAPSAPALVEHAEVVAATAAAEEARAVAAIARTEGPGLAAHIDAWFVEEIHNSPVSRAGAETYNHLRQAVENLKHRLAAL
jgi:hypothetical protein